MRRSTGIRVLNWLALLGMVGMSIYLVIVWNRIPDQIPTHFGLSGEADAYSGKSAILINPIVGWLLYGLVSVVARFPQCWNTGVKVTEENKERVYAVLLSMITFVNFHLVLIFVYTTVMMANGRSLHGWFMRVYLAEFFGNMIVHLIRLYQVGKE